MHTILFISLPICLGVDLKLELQTQNGVPYQLGQSYFNVDNVNTTSDMLYATELSNLKVYLFCLLFE